MWTARDEPSVEGNERIADHIGCEQQRGAGAVGERSVRQRCGEGDHSCKPDRRLQRAGGDRWESARVRSAKGLANAAYALRFEDDRVGRLEVVETAGIRRAPDRRF